MAEQAADAHEGDAHQFAVAALRHAGDAKSFERLPKREQEGEGADGGHL